jgi:predicted dehydrogenase
VDVQFSATPGSPEAPAGLGVAVIGLGWMGRVHTQAHLRVRHHFPDVPRVPHLVVAADAVPGRAAAAADQYGFVRATEDWRDVLADPQVQAVSVTLPNDLHREVGVAVARAGKHLWIEKPVGLTTDDAVAVAAAVADAGVQAAVGFNYRHVPAVDRARDLIASGAVGRVTHARFRLFSDYAADPEGALTWRYQRARGGSGVLGDLASHGVDLVRHLLGEVSEVAADTAVFLTQRARPLAATTGHVRGGGELGPVENDDHVACLLRLASGARVVLEASRVAVGAQNDYGFEVHGTAGLPADGGAAHQLRRRGPGPAGRHRVRRAGRRCLRRLPARGGEPDEPGRPQGDRGARLPVLDRRRRAAGGRRRRRRPGPAGPRCRRRVGCRRPQADGGAGLSDGRVRVAVGGHG